MNLPDIDQISLVVSDIDGTLVDSNSNLSKKTADSITKLRERGIHFALATGRTNMMISPFLEAFDYDLCSITCNGALVYDHRNNVEIFSQHLDKSQSIYILKEVRKRNWEFICYSKDCMYYSFQDDLIENRIRRLKGHFKYRKVKEIGEIEDIDSLIKIGVREFAGVDTNIVDQIAREAGTMLKNSGEKFKAIFPSGISKETGMSKLQDYLHTTADNTIVFGDYDNDLPLFRRAKYKVAVSNASKDVLNECNFVTSSNDEDGVSVFLDKLLFP